MNQRAATMGGLLALLLWSSTIAVARSLSESIGAISTGALTCLVSGILALIFSLRTSQQRQDVWVLPRRYLLICGALFMAYTLLLYLAVGWSHSRGQALIVGLLNYLWPVLTLLLSIPLLKRRARWTLWPATLMALLGIVMVLVPLKGLSWHALDTVFRSNPLVYLLAVLAALSWALYSNLTRKWAEGARSGGVALFLMAAAMLLSSVAAFSNEQRHFDFSVLLEVTFLGTATFVGYTLWDRAMRNGHMTLVTSASYLTPLLSTLVCAAYLGIAPGIEVWMGCLLLIIGSFISWRSLSG